MLDALGRVRGCVIVVLKQGTLGFVLSNYKQVFLFSMKNGMQRHQCQHVDALEVFIKESPRTFLQSEEEVPWTSPKNIICQKFIQIVLTIYAVCPHSFVHPITAYVNCAFFLFCR